MFDRFTKELASPRAPVKSRLSLILGLACAAILFAMVVPPSRAHVHFLSLNHTPSLPIGFYRKVSASDLVSFCLPEPWASLATERKYRTGTSGDACADGSEPLLKRIVGKGGDVITESFSGILVNGQSIRFSKPLPLDGKSRPLQPYLIGAYKLKPGEVWVMGDMPKSFDSRYYGPIAASAIRDYWQPCLTWKGGY